MEAAWLLQLCALKGVQPCLPTGLGNSQVQLGGFFLCTNLCFVFVVFCCNVSFAMARVLALMLRLYLGPHLVVWFLGLLKLVFPMPAGKRLNVAHVALKLGQDWAVRSSEACCI